MDFAEMIALLREPGENEIPGTIYDDLSGAYDGATAKIGQIEADNAALVADVARLKALNFDLLMAAAGDTEPDNNGNETDVDISAPSLDTLFERD